LIPSRPEAQRAKVVDRSGDVLFQSTPNGMLFLES